MNLLMTLKYIMNKIEIQLSNIYYKNESYDLQQNTNDIYLHLLLPDSINIDDYSNIEKYEIIDSPFLTTPFRENNMVRNFSDIIFPDSEYKLENCKFSNGKYNNNNNNYYINITKRDYNNYNINMILVGLNTYKQTNIYLFVLTYINTIKML